MTSCEDKLFSYEDLRVAAPWLTEETCRQLSTAGLFTPRMSQDKTDPETPQMNIFDLVAITAVNQLLRSGITEDQLRRALYSPRNFRCDGFPENDLIFLSTGCVRGQELSRFFEITNAEVTILIRLPLAGEAEMEIIPNELLGAGDYRGETLTGVECRAIRDIIEANIGSAINITGNESNNIGTSQAEQNSL